MAAIEASVITADKIAAGTISIGACRPVEPEPEPAALPVSNCPNCGAVLDYEGGLHCEYCGARFERPARVELRSDGITITGGLNRLAAFGYHEWR